MKTTSTSLGLVKASTRLSHKQTRKSGKTIPSSKISKKGVKGSKTAAKRVPSKVHQSKLKSLRVKPSRVKAIMKSAKSSTSKVAKKPQRHPGKTVSK